MADTSTQTAKPKQASLWEKTIVRAFRDLQWHYKGEDHPFPEPSAEFDGKLEQALGDGIAVANDQFFLLEMKAGGADKKTEWDTVPGKLPFETLKGSLISSDEGDEHAKRDMHVMSMRGHHFLYWAEINPQRKSILRPGALVISSYLLDLANDSPASTEDRAKNLSSTFRLGYKFDDRRYNLMSQIRASRLFTTTAALIEVVDHKVRKAFEIGLSATEMHTYVMWLVARQDEQNLPVNALLASRSGSVCQHVTSVDELIELMDRLNNDIRAESDDDLSGVELAHEYESEVEVKNSFGLRRRKSS